MGAKSLQNWQLILPAYSLSPSKKPASVISSSYSSLFSSFVGSSQSLASRLVYRSTLSGSSKSEGRTLNLACSASLDGFSDEELSKQIGELARRFDVIDDEHYNDKGCANEVSDFSGNFLRCKESTPFWTSKLEFLEPNLLGIQPEPTDWEESDEILRVTIERKANSFDIPLSLRIIKRKQQCQMGLTLMEAGEFAYCSVKKAFSSMVFIIRELQSYALHIRESLYCEDLQEILSKMQREMNASFVWLFQQVFSRTPTLMVYVMILLANFTVHSMAATPPIIYSDTLMDTVSVMEEKNHQHSKFDSSTVNKFSVPSAGVGNGGDGRKLGLIGGGTEGGDGHLARSLPSIQYLNLPNVVPEEISEFSLDGNHEMGVEEEVGLWKSMVEYASRMQAESKYKVLDPEAMQEFVSPVTVELEPDDYEEYFRTDLVYQMGVAEEPNNPLLLSNYAQFLYLVAHDHNRAEECFKRAILVEPPDAEAVSRYADFLWNIRKDLWAAEERYLQAMAAEPNNPYHASKYANFLWSTGGEDTCFPLNNTSYDNYNKVP